MEITNIVDYPMRKIEILTFHHDEVDGLGLTIALRQTAPQLNIEEQRVVLYREDMEKLHAKLTELLKG